MAARPQDRRICAEDKITLNIFPVPSYYIEGAANVGESSDRNELLRRLEQSRRLAAEPSDPLTKDRLKQLVTDLEEQLQLPK
jgi:hypothetical protein